MNLILRKFGHRLSVVTAVSLACPLWSLMASTTVEAQMIIRQKRRPSLLRCLGPHATVGIGPAVFQPNVPFGAVYDSLPYWQGSALSHGASHHGSLSDYPSVITPYDSLYRRPRSNAGSTVGDIEKEVSPTTRILNPAYHQQSDEERGGEISFSIISTLPEANAFQLGAERAFRGGRYSDAVEMVEHAMTIDPHNGMLRLFSSQANFAAGKFRVAATDLEAATKMLAPSQWHFFGRNFRSFYGKNDYVAQTRDLTAYVKRRPDDYQAKILLGYHLGIAGHRLAATRLFHDALKTNANDQLAQRLIPELGDASLPMTLASAIDAPSPATVGLNVNHGLRSNTFQRPSTAPKRIYLTSKFFAPPSTPIERVEQFEATMQPVDLIEAPGEVLMPTLDGPENSASEDEFFEQSVVEELPEPLEQ